MKRYAVFAGDHYYPAGGWEDFREAFDTIEEATAAAKTSAGRHGWSQVIDLHTGEEVYSQ